MNISSAITIIEQEIFKGNYEKIQDIIENDPVKINISPEDSEILPPKFLELANKLHQNYLYWKYLRDRQKTNQPTFYRYSHEQINQAAEKVAQTGTSIEPEILLILETKIALATINSFILAAEEYLKEGHLQDGKESVDTALSTLYEFIKTREKLELSLEKAVATIRQDIANDTQSSQYGSYLVTQILRLKDDFLLSEAKFYVVRHQLDKLGETLILLIPGASDTSVSKKKENQAIDVLMTRLLWAMAEEDAYTTTIKHDDAVKNITFSPDGTYLATASNDKTAKVVEVATGEVITSIQHRDSIDNINFSPDGTYLATASKDKKAKVVEVATGKVITTIQHGDSVYNVTFSPNGTYLATSSKDKKAKVVEVATGKVITTIQHGDSVCNVTFSSDGIYLATASWCKKAKVVEVSTGKVITTIQHNDTVCNFTFSSDGTYLATASWDKTAKVVKVATGKVITSIQHGAAVRNVTFSPDGTYLATTSWDKIAKVVKVATGKVITTIQHGDTVCNVTFSSDGTYLATASDDKTAKLVNLRKLSQLINEEKKPSIPQPQVSSLVHLEKSEAFFLAWLRLESNRYSFYEYMLKQAKREKEGLSVHYHSSVLDTNLLLESLGFLLFNAEKHYYTIYPTLINITEQKIRYIAVEDMKYSISAGLSSLHEFIAQRMELDEEDYNQAIQSFKREVEDKITNSELLVKICDKLQTILQLEGIQQLGELQTIKEMLVKIDIFLQQLLPEKIKSETKENLVIPIKQKLKEKEIADIIKDTQDDTLFIFLVF